MHLWDDQRRPPESLPPEGTAAGPLIRREGRARSAALRRIVSEANTAPRQRKL